VAAGAAARLSHAGLGAVLTLLFIFVVGLATRHNFIGQKLVKWWARWCATSVVGPIYTSVKQVSDTLLSSSGAFRKALLVHTRARLVDHRVPDRHAGRRRGQPPDGRIRQRLRADHAEPDLGLLPDAAEAPKSSNST
jgi:hypothetical protein